MGTITENTVQENAILTNDSISLENDVLYFTSLSVAKLMLKNGIINKKEFREMDTILRKKFCPLLADLFSENA